MKATLVISLILNALLFSAACLLTAGWIASEQRHAAETEARDARWTNLLHHAQQHGR